MVALQLILPNMEAPLGHLAVILQAQQHLLLVGAITVVLQLLTAQLAKVPAVLGHIQRLLRPPHQVAQCLQVPLLLPLPPDTHITQDPVPLLLASHSQDLDHLRLLHRQLEV